MAIETSASSIGAAARERYEAVIGIEVHCQLRTASKMFYDGAPPNTHVCPVCLGLPGALPVINRRAVEHVLVTGLAIEATTPDATRWDRKNYFYPDLPKGYQISQYDLPLASAGRLAVETSDGPIIIGITRAHLEEDTAKLVHATTDDGRKVSLIDFNRSGAPLMEIVTDPDIRTAEGARRYAEELQLLLRTIGASDADMERGQMRVEANVSLRARGSMPFGTRVEVKNMNSFRSVERAIAYEIDRQAAALDAGEQLAQETRGWSDDRGATYHMRSKETSDDYRYFPEPDLVPVVPAREWVEELRATLPEPPAARRKRLQADWGYSDLEFRDVVNAGVMDEIEETIAAGASASVARKWWMGEIVGRAKNADVDPGQLGVQPATIVELARMVEDGKINNKMASEVLDGVLAGEGTPAGIVAKRGLAVVSDDGPLLEAIDAALAAQPGVADKIRGGKVQAVGAIVGGVMKATRGQADAARVRELILEKLGVTV
jgi:aspartyl-tRNA(Asn)/glutamyl-tRNA(Gln) amidotransferase subunit B